MTGGPLQFCSLISYNSYIETSYHDGSVTSLLSGFVSLRGIPTGSSRARGVVRQCPQLERSDRIIKRRSRRQKSPTDHGNNEFFVGILYREYRFGQTCGNLSHPSHCGGANYTASENKFCSRTACVPPICRMSLSNVIPSLLQASAAMIDFRQLF